MHSSPRAGVRVRRRARAPSTSSRSRPRRGRRSSRTRSSKIHRPARRPVTPLADSGGCSPQHGLGGAQDLPDLARAGDRRRRRGAVAVSFVVLALAWRTPAVRRRAPAAGRPRPGSSAFVDSVWWRGLLRAGRAARASAYLVVVAVLGKDLLINPIFGIFYVWIWVGVPVASLLFGRVWRAISPFRLISAGIARVSGGDPDDGHLRLPRAARHVAGRASASTRSSGWSWSTPTTSTSRRSGCGCGVYLGPDDHRRRAVREHVLRAGRPVRGLLLAGRPGCRSGGAATGSWCCAARWPTSTRPRPRRAWSAVVAVLFGSTAFDAFRDSTRWLTFIQGTGYSTYLQNNLGLLGFCLAVGADLLRRHACHRRRAGAAAPRAARPVRATR